MFSRLLFHIIIIHVYITLTQTHNKDLIQIVDLIPYNGEPMALFRLEYLQDVVDLFVLVESRQTFSGKVKKDHYHLDKHKSFFRKYEVERKLLKLKLDIFPNITINEYTNEFRNKAFSAESAESWAKERYLKEYAVSQTLRYFENVSFIMMLCDADEIPRKNIVSDLKNQYDHLKDKAIGLEMLLFSYTFQWIKNDVWDRSRVVGDGWLRQNNSAYHVRKLRRKLDFIKNAGWHASNFFRPEQLLLKLESSIHAFDKIVDRPEILNLEWIQNSIESGRDILNRSSSTKEHQLRRYADIDNLPTVKRIALCISGQQLQIEKIKRFLIVPNTNYSFFLFYNYKSAPYTDTPTTVEMGYLESLFFHQASNVQRITVNVYPNREKEYTDFDTACMKQINEVQQDFFHSEFDHVTFIDANFNFFMAINISTINASSCGKFLPSKNCLFLK